MSLHQESRVVTVLSCNYCDRRVETPDGHVYFAPPLGWSEHRRKLPPYLGGGEQTFHACPDPDCQKAAQFGDGLEKAVMENSKRGASDE